MQCLRIITIIPLQTAILAPQTYEAKSSDVELLGTVRGTVFDANEAIITPVTIIFQSGNRVETVTTGEDGSYEIKLRSGIYNVKAEVNSYHPFRRAKFYVPPGKIVVINIFPSLKFLTRGTSVLEKTPPDVLASIPKYESLPPEHCFGGQIKPLIQFAKKRRVGKVIEYRGAILSYDVTTIDADKILFDRRKLRVIASGNKVIVETGGVRRQVDQASGNFENCKLVIDLNHYTELHRHR